MLALETTSLRLTCLICSWAGRVGEASQRWVVRALSHAVDGGPVTFTEPLLAQISSIFKTERATLVHCTSATVFIYSAVLLCRSHFCIASFHFVQTPRVKTINFGSTVSKTCFLLAAKVLWWFPVWKQTSTFPKINCKSHHSWCLQLPHSWSCTGQAAAPACRGQRSGNTAGEPRSTCRRKPGKRRNDE